MKIGELEVLEEIGRGGMGVVFRARAPGGRMVAVKLLRAKAARVREKFEREARLLGSLGLDEGFVPLLGSGATDQGLYLVMPLVTGGTLRDRLRAGPLTNE